MWISKKRWKEMERRLTAVEELTTRTTTVYGLIAHTHEGAFKSTSFDAAGRELTVVHGYYDEATFSIAETNQQILWGILSYLKLQYRIKWNDFWKRWDIVVLPESEAQSQPCSCSNRMIFPQAAKTEGV
jgi:hypothetical protein